jgi:hypothetical protein
MKSLSNKTNGTLLAFMFVITMLFAFNSNAQCTVVGDPAVFGSNTWNVYGYAGANINLTGVTYKGYYTQSGLTFDSTTAWGSDYSPSSATNWQGCTIANDNFTFVYKRKGFPCGRYTLAMTRWDDDAVVYLNGTQVWSKTGWSGGVVNEVVGTYDLDENSKIEVRVREAGGGANGALKFTPTAAPTSITGVTNLSCGVTSTTLTAAGGYAAGNTVYQWGTGTVVGQGIIAGATAATLTTSPAATTTYWVRLSNLNACTTYSSAVTTTVTVTPSPGDPAVYGSYKWNAYAYTGTNITLAGATYLGYYTQNTLGFDTTTGTNSWAKALSPSSASGYSGCTVTNDNFLLVYKRQGFECGSYKLTMTRWDDDTELYIDGSKVWAKTGWSGSTDVNEIIGTYTLGPNTTIEFRLKEANGDSWATLVVAQLTTASVAPSAINGPSSTQCGGSATLNAAGGTLGTNAVYEWGTGSVVGSNIISGATTASISVAPQTTTVYWVRIKNTLCGTYTSAAAYTVTAVNTVAGTLSATSTTVCKNSIPGAITLTGYSGSIIKWQYANDADFTNGVTDIANTTAVLTPAQIGMITADKYFRAVVQNGTCIARYTPVLQLSIPAPVVYNGTWSSTPTATTAIEVQADLTLDANLTVCSCMVKNTAVLTVNSDVNFTVKGKVTVAPTAKLILQNKASLLQTDDVANEGTIEAHRNSSKIRRLDYTIWSSPVDSQTLQAFSPATSTNRFYEYDTTNDNYMPVSNANNFELAKGYLIRAPNNFPTTPTLFDGVFTGTPHNGTITKALTFAGHGYNAVGNPYPSPISVNAFIDANIDNIEGTLWFWRKTNNAAQTSYTVLTKFAYVANTAPGGENDFAVNPNGYLNTGQGFFVKAKNAGNVLFTNAMRYGGSSNQFFKSAQTVAPSSKYYLNVTDAGGSFTQTVIGYTADATLEYDNGLDGRSFVDNNINIYSLQAENKLAIQARPEFDMLDIVPMGIKANIAGTFSISLANTDGIFADAQQPVLIWDTVEGIIFNLKNGPYAFTAEEGVYEERFKMIYSAQALGTNAPVLTESSVMIYGTDGQLKVTASEPIKSVTAYDMLGRELLSQANIQATTFSAGVTASQQVLIVKVLLENGQTAEKKVILK